MRMISDQHSRHMENPLLDGAHTPFSHQNLLNESGDSEMLQHQPNSLNRNNLNVMIGNPELFKDRDFMQDSTNPPMNVPKRTAKKGT